MASSLRQSAAFSDVANVRCIVLDIHAHAWLYVQFVSSGNEEVDWYNEMSKENMYFYSSQKKNVDEGRDSMGVSEIDVVYYGIISTNYYGMKPNMNSCASNSNTDDSREPSKETISIHSVLQLDCVQPLFLYGKCIGFALTIGSLVDNVSAVTNVARCVGLNIDSNVWNVCTHHYVSNRFEPSDHSCISRIPPNSTNSSSSTVLEAGNICSDLESRISSNSQAHVQVLKHFHGLPHLIIGWWALSYNHLMPDLVLLFPAIVSKLTDGLGACRIGPGPQSTKVGNAWIKKLLLSILEEFPLSMWNCSETKTDKELSEACTIRDMLAKNQYTGKRLNVHECRELCNSDLYAIRGGLDNDYWSQLLPQVWSVRGMLGALHTALNSKEFEISPSKSINYNKHNNGSTLESCIVPLADISMYKNGLPASPPCSYPDKSASMKPALIPQLLVGIIHHISVCETCILVTLMVQPHRLKTAMYHELLVVIQCSPEINGDMCIGESVCHNQHKTRHKNVFYEQIEEILGGMACTGLLVVANPKCVVMGSSSRKSSTMHNRYNRHEGRLDGRMNVFCAVEVDHVRCILYPTADSSSVPDSLFKKACNTDVTPSATSMWNEHVHFDGEIVSQADAYQRCQKQNSVQGEDAPHMKITAGVNNQHLNQESGTKFDPFLKCVNEAMKASGCTNAHYHAKVYNIRELLMLPSSSAMDTIASVKTMNSDMNDALKTVQAVIVRIERVPNKYQNKKQMRVFLQSFNTTRKFHPSFELFPDIISLYVDATVASSVKTNATLDPESLCIGMEVIFSGCVLSQAKSKKFVYLAPTPSKEFRAVLVGFASGSLLEELISKSHSCENSIYKQNTQWYCTYSSPLRPPCCLKHKANMNVDALELLGAPYAVIDDLVATRLHNRCLWTIIFKISHIKSITIQRKCPCCQFSVLRVSNASNAKCNASRMETGCSGNAENCFVGNPNTVMVSHSQVRPILHSSRTPVCVDASPGRNHNPAYPAVQMARDGIMYPEYYEYAVWQQSCGHHGERFGLNIEQYMATKRVKRHHPIPVANNSDTFGNVVSRSCAAVEIPCDSDLGKYSTAIPLPFRYYYCPKCNSVVEPINHWEAIVVIDDGFGECHMCIDDQNVILSLLGLETNLNTDTSTEPDVDAMNGYSDRVQLLNLIDSEVQTDGKFCYEAGRCFHIMREDASEGMEGGTNEHPGVNHVPSRKNISRGALALHDYILSLQCAEYDSSDVLDKISNYTNNMYTCLTRVVNSISNHQSATISRNIKLQRNNCSFPYKIEFLEYPSLCTQQLYLQAVYIQVFSRIRKFHKSALNPDVKCASSPFGVHRYDYSSNNNNYELNQHMKGQDTTDFAWKMLNAFLVNKNM